MRKNLTALALCLALATSAAACGNKVDHSDSTKESGSTGEKAEITGEYVSSTDLGSGFFQTAGTDDYGRSFGQVSAYNENVVGVFYFLWLSQASETTTIDSYVSQGKAENTLKGDEIPGMPSFTYWGEPMYGYYQVEDEWVVRKHVELFINAGLDFICFDATNNDCYQAAAKQVLDVLLEYKKLGYNVPKAMFMTNSDSTGMTEDIYRKFYRRNTYDDIWFTGNGSKPWIIADYQGGDAAIQDRFYFKAAQWPIQSFNQNKFPWISYRYPQETFVDAANDYGIMSVSVSQHTGIGGNLSDANKSGINFSLSGLYAPYNYDSLSDDLKKVYSKEKALEVYNANRGRGWSNAKKANTYEDAVKNTNFEEQWNTVYDTQGINLVFVTGWNEWIAQKQSTDPMLGAGYGYFVDTFDMEFSRDIEMMNGGYLDNCYLQLVKNIRKYKGYGFNDKTYNDPVADGTDMLDLANWANIRSYADLTGETKARDHAGVGSTYYKNETGRNDIREVRVASDSENLWFMIATTDAITAKSADDTRWMNLWIGVEGEEGGFNNLGYVVNRSLNGTTASLDKISNNAFESAGTCDTYVSGNVMIVRVKKSALGITDSRFGLQFKVTDNLQKDFDITDLYANGDCAPIGRINYSWYTK